MTVQTLTIQLPGPLFERLSRTAELLHRPLEEYIVQSLDVNLLPPDLPPQLQAELLEMTSLSDEALQAATKPSLSPAEEVRLRQLNHTAGERRLSEVEERELDDLLEAYQRSVLKRARALAILKLRGYPIPPDEVLSADLERA